MFLIAAHRQAPHTKNNKDGVHQERKHGGLRDKFLRHLGFFGECAQPSFRTLCMGSESYLQHVCRQWFAFDAFPHRRLAWHYRWKGVGSILGRTL